MSTPSMSNQHLIGSLPGTEAVSTNGRLRVTHNALHTRHECVLVIDAAEHGPSRLTPLDFPITARLQAD